MANAKHYVKLRDQLFEITAPETASERELFDVMRNTPDRAKPVVMPADSPNKFAVPKPLRKRDKEQSVAGAVARGFWEPRKGDPFGLNTENARFGAYNPIMSAARLPLELAESAYGGLKQGVGQALYNTGATNDDPRRAAAQAFELPEFAAALFPALRAGQAVPTLSQLAARYLPARPTPPMTDARRLYDAAQRQGVDLIAADVGGPTVRSMTGGLGGSIVAGPPIARAQARSGEQLSNAVSRVAGQAGNVVSEAEAGGMLTQGAQNYIQRTSLVGENLYRRADTLSQNFTLSPTTAISRIDAELAKRAAANDTTSPVVRELTAYRERLADPRGITAAGLTTIIRDAKKAGRHEEALRGTDLNRIMNGVAMDAERELLGSLARAGRPEAARAYRAANDFWRTRVDVIDNVLEPIVGANKSGEDVLSAVESMARGRRGGVARLGGLLQSMPVGAADDVRATIIDRLGRAAPSAQNADLDQFSPATFFTNWSKMSPEGKQQLFGNAGMRRDLDDIARLALSKKETSKLGNPSGTARQVEATALLTSAASIPFTPAGWVGIAAAAGARGVGSLLANPRVVRLLAGAPAPNAPAAQRATFAKEVAELAKVYPALDAPLRVIAANASNPALPEKLAELDNLEPDLSMYEEMSDEKLEDIADRDIADTLSDEELEAIAAQEGAP